MELRPTRALNAVRRPRASTLFETDMTRWMPIARGINRNVLVMSFGDPTIEDGHNAIPFSDAERAVRTKVVLDVDDEERIPLLHVSILNWKCNSGTVD